MESLEEQPEETEESELEDALEMGGLAMRMHTLSLDCTRALRTDAPDHGAGVRALQDLLALPIEPGMLLHYPFVVVIASQVGH